MIRFAVEPSTYPPDPVPPALLPCPFCGAAAIRERHPGFGEIVRISCASEACPITPRTEYLLTAYADELRSAWNARTGESGDSPGR